MKLKLYYILKFAKFSEEANNLFDLLHKICLAVKYICYVIG